MTDPWYRCNVDPQRKKLRGTFAVDQRLEPKWRRVNKYAIKTEVSGRQGFKSTSIYANMRKQKGLTNKLFHV